VSVVRFEVRGAPVSTNQGYRTIIRNGYRPALKLSDEAAWYKALLVRAASAAHRAAGRPPAIEQGAILAVRFTFPTLASDVDGPLKFVQDAVSNGSRGHPGAGLVVNDNRVRRLLVDKAECDGHPRTEVAVASPDEAGCPTCGCCCRRLLP
jgi:hypothetical protein